ncbi:hypothetical protein HK100_008112 [Physocladia obscura]|uniref:Uncharacterized protein n=1 Tax=Physocladia obscura TaxID=109957 RepID=A0AAD5TF78_9FUNG|nr:hypothetical protein HK100_008112 [Physocladia obscura]
MPDIEKIELVETIETVNLGAAPEIVPTSGHNLTRDKGLLWSEFQMPSPEPLSSTGDEYHVAGLFQVCGDRDFTYNNVTDRIFPTIHHNWTCQSFDDYVSNFQLLFVNFPDSDWAIQAASARKLIYVSRVFEALTTTMDMIFGVTTIWTVIYPNVNKKQQIRNMKFALVGVILTPVFCIADTFIQNSYWAAIGVGLYNTGIQTFLYASGDISWISSACDFVFQAGFLVYGVRKQHLLARSGDEIAMRAVDNI